MAQKIPNIPILIGERGKEKSQPCWKPLASSTIGLVKKFVTFVF